MYKCMHIMGKKKYRDVLYNYLSLLFSKEYTHTHTYTNTHST